MWQLAAWLALTTQASLPAGTLTEHVACRRDPSQTYTLYLPPGYAADRPRPLLLVFDPRGRGTVAAELFRKGAEQYGWIIASSDNTRSDGPWEPNHRALEAMWSDVHERYAVDATRIYAAGFSGGATLAWLLERSSRGLAGIIESGSPDTDLTATVLPDALAVFTAAGRLDFNYVPSAHIDARVARAAHPHRLEFFDGPHAWMPQPMATRAMAWLELVAMQTGGRDRDVDLAARVAAADVDAASALASAGRPVEASRVYASVVETTRGLIDVAGASRALAALENSDAFRHERDSERAFDERELDATVPIMRALRALDGDENLISASGIAADMGLGALQKTAARQDYAGQSAARLLEFAFVQTSFYLPRSLAEQRRFDRAAIALEIAVRIHPDRSRLWYELAANDAQSHAKGDAVKALEQALAHGFADRAALESDDRFASVKDLAAFKDLLARIGKAAATPRRLMK